MGRKKREVDDDFAAKIDEALFTEGLAANSPSELTDAQTEELWVKSQGWTPLEYLTHVYRNPWQETKDRITAAKAVLDYVHSKLPQRIKVEGSVVETRKLDAASLGKLSDEELEVFTKLLEKMGKPNES